MSDPVTLLVYHRLRPGHDSARPAFLDIPQADFLAHLDAFAAAGAQADGLFLRFPGPRLALLCFDDGRAEHAFAADALDQRGWRGLFFIPTAKLNQPGRLTSDQAADMAARGHELGSHGISHDRMDKMSGEQLDRELRQSREILEKLAKRDIPWLAPPGGQWRAGDSPRAQANGYRHIRSMIWGETVWPPPPDAAPLPVQVVTRRTGPDRATAKILRPRPTWFWRGKTAIKHLIGEDLWDRLRERLG